MAEGAFELACFKKGAYITTEGDNELDRFYIVKTGSVEQMATQFLFGKKKDNRKSEILKAGDFFGVISCMAKRSRMETVSALEDTTLVVIRRENFGKLIQNNTSIAMKIIRYFSRQLRYYDLVLTTLITRSSLQEHQMENQHNIYQIGEYYHRRKSFQSAAYAYNRYLETRPDGKFASDAKQKLSAIEPSQIILKPQMEDHLHVYADKQTIFLEGEVGNNLYVVQSGNVKITKIYNDKEILLNVLKVGDIFGEMAIIENKPRNANATASGQVKLMAITRENFEFVVKKYPDIAIKIIELLSDRIWLIYRQIANIFISDPETKIYDAIYTQLMKNRINVEQEMSYTFEYGMEDLIKFTGLPFQDGKAIIYKILNFDKTLFINPDGKFVCKNISHISRKLNVFRRDMEIEHNLANSAYSNIFNK